MDFSSNFLGLTNLGNTCYIAASLQCFFHVPRIFTYFSSFHQKTLPPSSENLTFPCILNLFREITSQNSERILENSEINAKKSEKNNENATFEEFLGCFKGFCDGSQQDAQEFLKLLLDRIHIFTNRGDPALPFKELKYQMNKDDIIQQKTAWQLSRERDNSLITDTFCGQLAGSLVCPSCKAISKNFEDFWDISLSFRDTSHKFDRNNKKTGYSLVEMLQNFLRSEEITGRKCPKCQFLSSKTTKTIEISRFPPVLILHLKRFYYKDYRREKLDYFVRFQMKNLSLGGSKGVKTVGVSYNLRGIIHHVGDLEHGHYYAECREVGNENWFRFDDERVEEIGMEEDECIKKGSDTAYILFYEKNKQ